MHKAPTGTTLAFDFGEVRIGVAEGDAEVGTAHPLATVTGEGNEAKFAAIAKLVAEWQPRQLVVGLPAHTDGSEHELTRLCRKFGRRLHGRFGLPVYWVDERLSSLYAESLLAFWLQHAPHAQLFARNLPVKNEQNGQTLGALDFVCALNGKIYHLELTCKYYGAASGRPSEMAGLNPRDRLIDKAAKLTQQLAWSRHAAGAAALQQAGIAADKVQAASLVRGIGFSAAGQAASIAPLNACGWHGLYIGDWAQYPLSDGLQTRCYLLPPMHILSPVRVPPAYAEEIGALAQIHFGQVALLQKRPDGYWHETARLMKAIGSEAV